MKMNNKVRRLHNQKKKKMLKRRIKNKKRNKSKKMTKKMMRRRMMRNTKIRPNLRHIGDYCFSLGKR